MCLSVDLLFQMLTHVGASPDGYVYDPDNTECPHGILEVKNPYRDREESIDEACKSPGFCLEKKGDKMKLKVRPDYYFQIQCELYCTKRSWCDFVVRTEKALYIERVKKNPEWWLQHIKIAKSFYFSALLAELTSPRYRKGGIREHVNFTLQFTNKQIISIIYNILNTIYSYNLKKYNYIHNHKHLTVALEPHVVFRYYE